MSSRAGLTVTEMMVALAVSSLLLLAATEGSLFGYNEAAHFKEEVAVQRFILEEEKSLASEKGIQSILLEMPADSLIRRCLTEPCLSECRQVTEWQESDWGRIKAVFSGDNQVNIGSAFRQQTDLSFKSCTLRVSEGLDKEKYYDSSCQHRAVAQWKSASGDSLLLRIRYKNKAKNISREILHRLPLKKNHHTGTCQAKSAVSCSGSNIYVTSVNLKEESFDCQYIRGTPAEAGQRGR